MSVVGEAITVEVMPGVVIRPGDILVLQAGTQYMTHEQAENLREGAMARLPGLADVVVLSAVTVGGVYRDDEDGDE